MKDYKGRYYESTIPLFMGIIIEKHVTKWRLPVKAVSIILTVHTAGEGSKVYDQGCDTL